MIATMKQFSMLLVLALSAISVTQAFTPNSRVTLGNTHASHTSKVAQSNTMLMAENPYNYNEGQSPWGLKKNGEIWNGRVAMVGTRSFLVVKIHERRKTVLFLCVHLSKLLINV